MGKNVTPIAPEWDELEKQIAEKKDEVKSTAKWKLIGYVAKGAVGLGVETICFMSPLGKMATAGLKGFWKFLANAGALGICTTAVDTVVDHVDKELDDLADVIADFIVAKEKIKNESKDA